MSLILSPLEFAIADAGQDDGEPLVYFYVYRTMYEQEAMFSVSAVPPHHSDLVGVFGVRLMAGPFSNIGQAREVRNALANPNFFNE